MAQEHEITIPGPEAAALLAAKNARACLLYLRLRMAPAADPARDPALAAELGWSVAELRAAAAELESLGLLPGLLPRRALEPPEELPEYSAADITRAVESDAAFSETLRYTQTRLGRTLTTPDIGKLLGIYQEIGLPAGALMLLVSYCDDRAKRRSGETARVTLRQIEKEAFVWVREGVATEQDAELLVRRLEASELRQNRLLRLLQISGRSPTATERGYLRRWSELPLSDEVIYAAYDKTVVNTGSLKWGYMNRILEDWAANGVPEEVDPAGARREPARQNGGAPAPARETAPSGGAAHPGTGAAGGAQNRRTGFDPDRLRRLREREEKKQNGGR